MTETTSTPTSHRFEAEVSQVLKLVINSLYSNRDIFLRELVSNASDAIDKLRFRGLTESGLYDAGSELKISISANKDAGTLTISDNGVGMTEAELKQNLGTIAHSGTQTFLSKLSEARSKGETDLSLIGQFGVGFYSAYLVADQVTVVSRAAGTELAHRWQSEGRDSYEIGPAIRLSQGTDITLHLKDDAKEFLDSYRLKSMVREYSDYIPCTIEVATEKDGEQTFERANQGTALWKRNPKEVTEEQYEELYKHLTHDWETPLAHQHFRVEGTQEFAGVLFVPKRAPFDLHMPSGDHGVRLYVKRVFILDKCEELLPKWLRFVKGLLDSEDLPLNVSREMLQDSSVVRNLRKQVTRIALQMLEGLAAKDSYRDFWTAYGPVLKEGLYFEPEHQKSVVELLRYTSSGSEFTSLKDYVSRMKDGQEAIYYLVAPNRTLAENSPHLEALKSKGFEVLYMLDAVDQWAMEGLTEYEGKKFVSAAGAELHLDENDTQAEKPETAGLTKRLAEILAEEVSEVRVSTRLMGSPACLVIPEGGVAPYIERLLQAQGGVPKQKRVLEINPKHELIASLEKLCALDANHADLPGWAELLYGQALVAEGSPITNTNAFSSKLTQLMTDAATRAVTV